MSETPHGSEEPVETTDRPSPGEIGEDTADREPRPAQGWPAPPAAPAAPPAPSSGPVGPPPGNPPSGAPSNPHSGAPASPPGVPPAARVHQQATQQPTQQPGQQPVQHVTPPPPAPTAPPTVGPQGPYGGWQEPAVHTRNSDLPATEGEAAVAPSHAATPAEQQPGRSSATDFLDQRGADAETGPATWGWRGRVRRWTGGLVKPQMGEDERAYEADRADIQRDFDGPRTIAFINPKGGAAKTTGVLAAGYTFGTVRGGGVIAWDNNETRGTLGIRGTRGQHRNTTRELLENLDRFSDVQQSRIGDLGAFVRAQGDAHFDVLASDERPHVTGTIHARDFGAVHRLLERFYRIILVDTGNNMRAENWLAAAEAADLLVVTSTVREDTGYSGLWMLDALEDAGYAEAKRRTITVLSDPSPEVDEKLAEDLTAVYEQRTGGVFRVPYDPVLVSGSVVPYAKLSEETRQSWLRACAAMARAL